MPSEYSPVVANLINEHLDKQGLPKDTYVLNPEADASHNREVQKREPIFDDMHVFMSFASLAGEWSEDGRALPRQKVDKGEQPSPRTIVSGNMSEGYAQLDAPELKKPGKDEPDVNGAERITRANDNVVTFVENIGYKPENVVILRPTNPGPDRSKLRAQNLDEIFTPGQSGHKATWLAPELAGDFVFTRNPEIVMGVRPADCPILVLRGVESNGEAVQGTAHLGWQNLNADHLDQVFQALDAKGVDRSTLEIYIGPGAAKENFPYSNAIKPGDDGSRFNTDKWRDLIDDLRYDDKEQVWKWNIDMFGFVDKELERLGILPKQIMRDGSDTARMDTGYNSNARARRAGTNEVEGRDLFINSIGAPKVHAQLQKDKLATAAILARHSAV